MTTHKFDAVSFLAGVVITILGLVFLVLADLGNIIDFFTDAGAWFWPTLFIAIGLAILVPVITRREAQEDIEEQEEADA